MPSAPPNARARGKSRKEQRRAQNKLSDQWRGSAASRGYDADWDRARRRHLQVSPLCRYCELQQRTTAATLVDHLYPHKGDMELFWEEQWWVSSCSPCHSGFKQRLEMRGRASIDELADLLALPRRAA